MMKWLPVIIFSLAGLLIVVTIVFGQTTVDIQLSDRYYVVSLIYLSIPESILLLAQGLVYSRMISSNRFPNVYLAVAYLTGTIVSFIGVAFSIFKGQAAGDTTYYTWTSFEPEEFIVFVLLYILSQFVFLLSTVLVRKANRREV